EATALSCRTALTLSPFREAVVASEPSGYCAVPRLGVRESVESQLLDHSASRERRDPQVRLRLPSGLREPIRTGVASSVTCVAAGVLLEPQLLDQTLQGKT